MENHGSSSSRWNCRVHKGYLGDEQGIAMVVVLVMLLLLTILGTTVFISSTTELRVSGNYRNDIETFYNADAAMEYAQTLNVIYTFLGTGTNNVWPTPGAGTASSDRDYNEIQLDASGSKKALVKVDALMRSGSMPPGLGTEEDSGLSSGGSSVKYGANYYAVSVIGIGPNNAKTELETQIVKIVPK